MKPFRQGPPFSSPFPLLLKGENILSLSCAHCLLYSQPQLQVYPSNTHPQPGFLLRYYYSSLQSNSGWENHSFPCVFECIGSEKLVSLLNESSAMRKNQSSITKGQIQFQLLFVSHWQYLSFHQRQSPILSWTEPGLGSEVNVHPWHLGILPRLCSDCCNHPTSYTVGESLLPVHHALTG